MNLEQIVRKARFEVDAIRADASTSALWSDEEVRDAVNDAMESAARVLRLADSDILTTKLRSTDASANYVSEDYDPGSLQLTADTSEYTLPPDLVSIVNIVPITEGYDGIHFYPAKLHQRLFTDQRTVPTADLSSVQDDIQTYLYTQIGRRTLKLAPTPKDTIDIELHYRYRPKKLFTYETGEVTINSSDTAVLGNPGKWYSAGVRTPADLIIPAGSSVSLQKYYPSISVLSADGSCTLTSAWADSTQSNATNFAVTMIPELPEEHHTWLAKMTAALLLRKINLDISEKARGALEQQLMNEIQPEVTMRQVQESLPVEPFNPAG